jgi:hypothetical protein
MIASRSSPWTFSRFLMTLSDRLAHDATVLDRDDAHGLIVDPTAHRPNANGRRTMRPRM